jgi:hypothetical protein
MSVSSEECYSICAHCGSKGNGCAHCCGDEQPPTAKAKAKAKPADDRDDDCCGDEPPPKAKAACDDDFDEEPAPKAKAKPADGIGGWLHDCDDAEPDSKAHLPDHGFSLGGRALTATDGRNSWRRWEKSKGKGNSWSKDKDKRTYYDYNDYYEKKLNDQETRIANLEAFMDRMDRRTTSLKEKLEAAERELHWWRTRR